MNRTLGCIALTVLMTGPALWAQENFKRGDANGDGCVSILDVDLIILFLGPFPPFNPCPAAADASGDGSLDITDQLLLLNYIFTPGAPPPPAPGPFVCGPGTPGDLPCETYDSCAVDCCVARIVTGPQSGSVPFTVSVAAEEVPEASYSWDFGDGSMAVTTENTVTHTYDDAGTFDVQLTVTKGTCTASTVAENLVAAIPPNPGFIRGDVNHDTILGLPDVIVMLDFLFAGGSTPDCVASVDVDDSGGLDIVDPVALLDYLFSEGGEPSIPFPGCGLDPTADDLTCTTVCP